MTHIMPKCSYMSIGFLLANSIRQERQRKNTNEKKTEEMDQRYLDYASYNIWANDRLINDLLALDNQLLTKEVIGSYPTIRATLIHIWFAETGWLSRLKENGWDTKEVTEFKGTNKELFKVWKKTSQEFKEFTATADLEKEIHFEHKAENFSIPIREIIQTVCNHGSYHRGQIVMMMRQFGVNKIAQTDYIEWVREKKRGNIGPQRRV